MNKIKRIHVLIVIGSILLITMFSVISKQKKTDYIEVVENVLNKPVEGIAVILEDVVSLHDEKFISIDVETDLVNGKLKEREYQENLSGYAIELFKELDSLEEIRLNSKFKDTGYWRISLNVDFVGGTANGDPHKLMFFIDKESHNILVPEEVDAESIQTMSFTNYRCFVPNNSAKEVINDINEIINEFYIPATEANYTLDQNYGVTMVGLEYASDTRLIFRGAFGLFVYDLIKEEMFRSVDLEQIKCDLIQGSQAAEVHVNQEGTMIQIHRMDSDIAYLYDIEQNIYTSSIYIPIEDGFNMQDSYDEGLMEDGLVSAYCVKFGEDDYGYLYTSDYSVRTLEYIRGDRRYLLFKDEMDRQNMINERYSPLEQLPEDYSLAMAKKDLCVVYENGDITEGQEVWDKFLDKTEKGQPSMVRLSFYYTLRDPSRYSKEHYEEIKDDYPVLYPMDLAFEGEKYSLKFYDEGKLISREYLYMMKYEGQPNSEATFSDYTYYVLVNDNSVTWEEIQKGMYSSQMGDAIEHYRVYSDIVYK